MSRISVFKFFIVYFFCTLTIQKGDCLADKYLIKRGKYRFLTLNIFFRVRTLPVSLMMFMRFL